MTDPSGRTLQQQRSSEFNRARGKGSLAADGHKRCSKCGTTLPVDQFSRSGPNADRLHSWCKRCNRSAVLFAKHGLTLDDYEALVRQQGGACKACHEPLDDRNRSRGTHPIDHCHATGRVRGVLCNGCNAALGFLKEDPDRAAQLIVYMQTVCKV